MRKGPEHVPDSAVVLLFAVGLLLLATSSASYNLATGEITGLAVSIGIAVLGYLLFWLVLVVTGFNRRLLPTIASIMACGSILTLAAVAATLLLTPIVDRATVATVYLLIAFWSVPVKGHIIARAIEQHWFVGNAISVIVFILQYLALQAMTRPA